MHGLLTELNKFFPKCFNLFKCEYTVFLQQLQAVVNVLWARAGLLDCERDHASLIISHPLAHGDRGLGAGARWLKPACAQEWAIERCQSQARCILSLWRSCCLRALHLNIWLGNDPRSLVLQVLGMTAMIMRTGQMRRQSDLWQPAVKRSGEVVKSQANGSKRRRGGDGLGGGG